MFVKLLSPQSLGQRHGNCTSGDLQLVCRMNVAADDYLKREKGYVVFNITYISNHSSYIILLN